MRTFPSQQIIYVFFSFVMLLYLFQAIQKSPLNEHENSELSKEGKHSTA